MQAGSINKIYMSKSKIIVAVLLVVIIVVILVSRGREEYVALVQEDNAVLVADQAPGDEVTVSYVKLKNPGYVSVYSKNASGTQELLGQSVLLSAGEHKNVSVKLTKKLRSGSTTHVVVNQDNGDGVFNEGDDAVVVSDDGQELASEIVILEDAPALEEVDLVLLAEEEGYMVNNDNDFESSVQDEADMNEGDANNDESTMEEGASAEEVVPGESDSEETQGDINSDEVTEQAS